MKTRQSNKSWLIAGLALFSNVMSLAAIAAETTQNHTCSNPDGICIKKIQQEEDRVSVTFHNNGGDTSKKFHYFHLRYSGAGYSSGTIKIKPDQKSYRSVELKLGQTYKFEFRGCSIITTKKTKCTQWQSQKIKLQG